MTSVIGENCHIMSRISAPLTVRARFQSVPLWISRRLRPRIASLCSLFLVHKTHSRAAVFRSYCLPALRRVPGRYDDESDRSFSFFIKTNKERIVRLYVFPGKLIIALPQKITPFSYGSLRR